jgi:uncharacterized protein YkwD
MRHARSPEPVPRTLWQAAAFLLGLWLALLLWPGGARSDERDAGAPFAELEASFHDEVNAVRSARHLIPLRRLPEIDRVARAHSEDMARRTYLSHITPEGRNPVDRLYAGGVTGFSLAAENAGMTSRGSPNDEILQGWLHSDEHRRNLYMAPFNATGIGVARAADGTWYYTQLYVTFAR